MKPISGILITSIVLLSACDTGGGEGNINLVDDSFDSVGNTRLEVGVAAGGQIAIKINGSVLDNDTHSDGAVLTVTDSTSATGSVTMNEDGSFVYLPAAGMTGVDSFTYEASDGTNTATAEVSINLEGRIWFVDNRVAGGDGSSTSPMATLAEAALAAESGDTIYLDGDGTSSGSDQGLALTRSNIQVIGAGVALRFNNEELAAAGTSPILESPTANIINLGDINDIHIAGLTLNASVEDAILINNSSGVSLETLTIQNSGASAIEGLGDRVDLNLTDVNIMDSDVADASLSDDAIYIHANLQASLMMSGGLIDNVPGNLGDGIVLSNDNSTTAVDMMLQVQGVSFSNIEQDAIKVDNENGLVDVQIGGSEPAQGNNLGDIGYRGIVIMSDGDPGSGRSNQIFIQNNIISTVQDAIQVRGIDDISQISITDNTIVSAALVNASDAIDIQQEFSARGEARISNNMLSGITGLDDAGIRLRLFDGASLAVEAGANSLDAYGTAISMAVHETTTSATSRLDATVTNNMLINTVLPDVAMLATNHDSGSETCLDLQGNTSGPEYQVAAIAGSFESSQASQTINLLQGSITATPVDCALPTF